jgi:hypothetical protein
LERTYLIFFLANTLASHATNWHQSQSLNFCAGTAVTGKLGYSSEASNMPFYKLNFR